MAQRAGRRTRKHRYSFVTQSGFLSSESNALLRRGVCFGRHFGRVTLTYGMFRDIYILLGALFCDAARDGWLVARAVALCVFLLKAQNFQLF